jgi:hypothetical protein
VIGYPPASADGDRLQYGPTADRIADVSVGDMPRRRVCVSIRNLIAYAIIVLAVAAVAAFAALRRRGRRSRQDRHERIDLFGDERL